MSGYIKIHRALFDHPVVGFHVPAPRAEKGKRPVPPFMAWEWMLSRAAFKAHEVQDNRGNVTEMERGQILAGRAYLADAWGWTEQNVRTFLKKLHAHDMVKINQSSNRSTSVITICNYESYQGAREDTNQPTNQALTKHSPSPNHTEEGKEGKEKETTTARTRDWDEIRSKLFEAIGKAGNRTAAALENLSEPIMWLEHGADLECDVLPTIRRLVDGKPPNAIKSWRFFTSAVAEAKRNREATGATFAREPNTFLGIKLDPTTPRFAEPADDPYGTEAAYAN